MKMDMIVSIGSSIPNLYFSVSESLQVASLRNHDREPPDLKSCNTCLPLFCESITAEEDGPMS